MATDLLGYTGLRGEFAYKRWKHAKGRRIRGSFCVLPVVQFQHQVLLGLVSPQGINFVGHSTNQFLIVFKRSSKLPHSMNTNEPTMQMSVSSDQSSKTTPIAGAKPIVVTPHSHAAILVQFVGRHKRSAAPFSDIEARCASELGTTVGPLFLRRNAPQRIAPCDE
jgi:hypothetical protein